MPSYEYICEHCERKTTRRNVEVVRRDNQACSCGRMLVRVASAPAFHLKGSGFHVNDYDRRKP